MSQFFVGVSADSLPPSVATSYISNSGTAIPIGNALNILGLGSLVTLGTGNTISIGFTGLTNHAILVASSSNTLTNLGPSSIAGQIVQSNGPLADPSFSTATYPSTSGTTGNVLTSNGTNWISQAPAAGVVVTQYDALSGGAGNTIVSFGPGTSGQIYQSKGAGSNPAYTTSTYPSTNASGDLIYGSGSNSLSTLAVNTRAGSALASNASLPIYQNKLQYVYEWDDFINAGLASKYVWQSSSTGTGSVQTNNTSSLNSNAHPGVVTCSSGASTGAAGVHMGFTTAGWLIFGGGYISQTFVMNLSALSNGTDTFNIQVGFGDSGSTAAPSNGAWISYTDSVNSGNYVSNTSSASTQTNTNSSTLAASGWTRFRIDVDAAAANVHFYINDVELANSPISTHIPTTQLAPYFSIIKTAGTTVRTFTVDYWDFYQQLTSSR